MLSSLILLGLLGTPPENQCAQFVEIRLVPQQELEPGAALEELASVDFEPCLPMVLQALEEGDQDTRRAAAYLLSTLPMMSTDVGELLQRHAEQLLPYVEDPDPKVRLAILGAILYMRPAAPSIAFEPVVGALNDPSPEIREGAVSALGAFRSSPKPAIDQLMPIIRERGPFEREALFSLHILLSHAEEDLLTEEDIQLLLDRASSQEDTLIQERAIRALGSLKDPPAEVLTRLEEIAADPQAAEHIRNNARSYLKRLRKHE